MLERGELDLGLIQGTSAYEALAGIGRPPTAARIVGAMYSSPGMFVVRADTPFRRVGDLKGRRIVLGAASSGLVVQARYVLTGLGLDPDRDFEPVLLEKAGDGPPMVLDGQAAALWGGGVGWPGFARVAAGPAGARFVGLDPAEAVAVEARHPFLKPMTVPAGSYPGIIEPLLTVGAWNVVMARPDLPEGRMAPGARHPSRRGRDRPPAGAARETTAASTWRRPTPASSIPARRATCARPA
jgi:hypothetical protein